MCACAVLVGACTGLCEPCARSTAARSRPSPCPAQRLTSRKHSRSSENSGSLVSTVETISSKVCSEAAQRVCVSLLNSGCDGRKAGCLGPPCRGRLPATHADTHTDTRHSGWSRGLKSCQEPRAGLGHGQEVGRGLCTLLSCGSCRGFFHLPPTK